MHARSNGNDRNQENQHPEKKSDRGVEGDEPASSTTVVLLKGIASPHLNRKGKEPTSNRPGGEKGRESLLKVEEGQRTLPINRSLPWLLNGLMVSSSGGERRRVPREGGVEENEGPIGSRYDQCRKLCPVWKIPSEVAEFKFLAG